MITVLFIIVALGLCFALLALRILLVKDGAFRGGRCSRGVDDGRGDCALCPNAASCPDAPREDHEPKSSNAMFSGGTPNPSNIRKQACSIGGGPQR